MTKPLAAQYEVKWLQIINKASCCGRVWACVRLSAGRPALLLWTRILGAGRGANDFSVSVFLFFIYKLRRPEDAALSQSHAFHRRSGAQSKHNAALPAISPLSRERRVQDDACLVVPFASNTGSGFGNTSGSLSSLPSVRSRKGGKRHKPLTASTRHLLFPALWQPE